jgi:hypothetical protein
MIHFSPAVISDRLQAFTRALDSDATQPGKLWLLDGVKPSPGQPVGTSRVLCELVFLKPSLSGVSGSTLTLRNPATALATVSGSVSWARALNGSGQYVADMDVGLDGSGAAVILNTVGGNLTLYAGGEVTVSVARLVES